MEQNQQGHFFSIMAENMRENGAKCGIGTLQIQKTYVVPTLFCIKASGMFLAISLMAFKPEQ